MRGLLIALAACGGGESVDPHAAATCDPGAWILNGEELTHCELGCATGPMQGIDDDGDGLDDRCPQARCPVAFMADDVELGCCLPDVGETIADTVERFKVCK